MKKSKRVKNMNQIKFKILFRAPKYPVIIVSANRLYSAFDINQLAEGCISSVPIQNKDYIQVVDSTGSEFWYMPKHYTLSPGFVFKKWTKKQIIEIFNNNASEKRILQEYSMKSLSSKRLDKIIHDICTILKS
ncbi:hypothetical protein [Desulfobacter postgatei]|uniref:hypothetical protein n=1 Tax=Desulfobacter postgatei TaxID=2293 RepID=UPI00259BC00B|nr:hypothetical protein [uncultured Desulfobacter sp.]